MARVPVINERSVEQQGLPAAYQRIGGVSLDAFGGSGNGSVQGGRELQQAGGDLGDFALTMQAEDNDLEARQLETEWRTRVSTMLYGGEGGPGYLSTKSNDAIAGFGPTRQQVEEFRSEIEGRASNDAVRSVFADVSTGQMLANLDRMASHLGTERITAQTEASMARMTQYINDAAADYENPAVFNEAVAVTANEVTRMADLNGWSEEVTQAAMAEQYDALVSGVVNAALVNDPSKALDIFADTAGLMSGVQRAKLAGLLEQETRATVAQALAEEARAALPGGDIKALMAYVDANSKGEVQNAAMDQLLQRYNLDQSIASANRAATNYDQGQEDRRTDQAATDIVNSWVQEGLTTTQMLARANAEGDADLAARLRADVSTYAAQVRSMTDEQATAVVDLEVASEAVRSLDLLNSEMTRAEAYAAIDADPTLTAGQRKMARAEVREVTAARDAGATDDDKAAADDFVAGVGALDSDTSIREALTTLETSDLTPTQKEYARSRIDYYINVRKGDEEDTLEDEARRLALEFRSQGIDARKASTAAIEDPELRLEVERLLSNMAAVDTASEVRESNAALTGATRAIYNGGRIADLPPATKQLLMGDGVAWENLVALERQQIEGRVPTTDDFTFMVKAFDIANTQAILDNEASWLLEARTKLTPQQYSRFAARVTALRDDAAMPPDVAMLGTVTGLVSDVLEQNGVEDDPEIGQVLYDLLNQEQQAAGRDLTYPELRAMANRLFIQADPPGGWNARQATLEIVQDFDDTDDIPAKIRGQLLSLYQAGGVDPASVSFEQLRTDLLRGLASGRIIVGRDEDFTLAQ